MCKCAVTPHATSHTPTPTPISTPALALATAPTPAPASAPAPAPAPTPLNLRVFQLVGYMHKCKCYGNTSINTYANQASPCASASQAEANGEKTSNNWPGE